MTDTVLIAIVVLIAVLSAAAFWFEIPSPFVLLGAGVLGVVLFGRRRF